MNFDELDARMRRFETAHDHCVLPGIHMVARLDGRSFTRLTKEVHRFEAPFDERFRDHMLAAASHLMDTCGTLYGYLQSDEISILFPRDTTLFDRKLRKLTSVLAGEASAVLSLRLGAPACLDCRISTLPLEEFVLDYFRWRQEDAHRNALNAHCYWALRKEGKTSAQATAALKGRSVADKNELLFQRGTNYNELPLWQKRGVGLYWGTRPKTGVNPKTGQSVTVARRSLQIDLELPRGEEYADFLKARLA